MTRDTAELRAPRPDFLVLYRADHMRRVRKHALSAKLALYAVNVILFIIAGLCLGLGLYFLIQFKALYLEDLIPDVTIVTAFLWIFPACSAACLLFIPMCGCYGVVSQNTGVIVSYFVFLLLLLVLSLVLAVLDIVGADMIIDKMKTALSKAVSGYHDNHSSPANVAVNELQQAFQCCGADDGVRDFGSWGPQASCTPNNFFKPCNQEVFRDHMLYRNIIICCSVGFVILLGTAMILSMTLVHYLRKIPVSDGTTKLNGFDNINYIAEAVQHQRQNVNA